MTLRFGPAGVETLLGAIRQLIENPADYVPGGRSLAKNAKGKEVDPRFGKRRAVRWSLRGAMIQVQSDRPAEFERQIWDFANIEAQILLCRFVPYNGIMQWEQEPGRTHEDVLDLLDRAIERSKTEYGPPES